MNFKDTWATNKNGDKFVFTVEMQRMLSEKGLAVDPKSLTLLEEFAHLMSEEVAEETDSQTKEVAFEEPASIQIDPETGKYIGRVKWYNVSKGYGFISRGGGEDIFFHKTDTICDTNELAEGIWILYDVEETNKGLEASEVELYQQAE